MDFPNETGRESARVWVDALTAFDSDATDEQNLNALHTALQGFLEVGAFTVDEDYSVDLSHLVFSGVVVQRVLASKLAQVAFDGDEARVSAWVRERIEG